MKRRVLWWGRFDPDYSRNRVLRAAFNHLGWEVVDYRPRLSALGEFGAGRFGGKVDLVWVPCFRQRDLAAASRWARGQGLPLIFDPLISAYDKQVFERGKVAAGSRGAERLRSREQRLMQRADLVLADTTEHESFFATTFALPREQLAVIPVGAEEQLFRPQLPSRREPGAPLQVLFYGSFIGLQGPQVIVEAARLYQGPPVDWRLVGEGPLLPECRRLAEGVANLHFEPWQPYLRLPATIAAADVVLGVFGTSDKAARVIPNKVYQALACGRTLVTRRSPAYPAQLLEEPAGIFWVEAGSAADLARTVASLAASPATLPEWGALARRSFERHFSQDSIRMALQDALTRINLKTPAKDD